MIKVDKVTDIDLNQQCPDLYGYFCFGAIWYEEDKSFPYLDLNCGYECVCHFEDTEFKMIALKIGISKSIMVLTDFSKVPDMVVLKSDEVLEDLKLEISCRLKETNLYLGSIDHNCESSGYLQVDPSWKNGIASPMYIAPYSIADTNQPVLTNGNTLNSLSSAATKIGG